MQYNICETCGACDGRAGLLIGKVGGPSECLNCHETRKSGSITIHSHLQRTGEELSKTFAILDGVK